MIRLKELDWKEQDLDQTFNKIIGQVSVKEKQAYTPHYNNVIKHVVNEFKKKNDLFKSMFHTPELGGSCADNVKVGLPDEFDADFILKLPSRLKILKSESRKDYLTIFLEDEVSGELAKLMKDGYLSQNKVLDWMKGILNLVFPCPTNENSFSMNDFVYDVKKSQTSPAMTLKVRVPKETNMAGDVIAFNVDIVVSFLIKNDGEDDIWIATTKYPSRVKKSIHWIAISKPDKSNPASLEFRASYRAIEKHLLYNRGKLKDTIRLFKDMRNIHGEGLTNLRSYHIKTMFMLYDQELVDTNNERFWDTASRTKCFITVKTVLQNKYRNWT